MPLGLGRRPAAALVVGKRKGYGARPLIPHNLTLTLLGVGLLWFGCVGFNAAGELAADGIAVNAFLVTHVAAAYCFIVTVITLYVVKATMGLRVTAEEEEAVDTSAHGELGYNCRRCTEPV